MSALGTPELLDWNEELLPGTTAMERSEHKKAHRWLVDDESDD
jgi:hypothetical protein